MRDIVKEYQEKFRRNHQRARRYTALLLALALTTGLFVNWQLHGVGIAKTAEYLCGELEHEHTAACYEKQLVCGYEEGEPEDWNATMTDDGMSFDDTFGMDDDAFGVDADDPGIAAYSAEPEYIFVPHEHTDDCYQEVQELTCREEEHEHTDDCFDPEDGSLICDLFEHTHDDSCYTTTYELVCGLEEGELVEEVNPDYDPVALFEEPVAAKPVVVDPVIETPVHHHTDACYEEVLVCGLPEHHHTVNCLSDPQDGTQDEDEWLAQTGTALTGMWNEDLLTVAQGQLGYEQSEKNFKLDTDDGETLRYYTRYGQWYGNPYGEWDVMFLSYCLNYANIPQSAIPQRASTLALRSELRSTDYLLDPDSDIAAYEMDAGMSVTGLQPGDIVFYNATTTETVAVADEPQIEDLSPDADTELLQALSAPAAAEPQTEERTVSYETVGIVSAVDEASGTMTVISGNVDGKVAEVSLALSQLTGVIPVASVQAAESAGTAVQSGDITGYVYDFAIRKKDGNSWIPATDFTTSDSVQAEFDFKDIPVAALENGADGSYFAYIPLPEGIDCSMLEGGDIKDSDYQGGVSGKYSFKKEGDHWVVVLNYDKDYIEQHEQENTKIKGDVSFEFQWDESSVTEEGKKKIITVNGKNIEITIKKDEEPQPSENKFSLNKKAGKLTYDEKNKKATINYTVTLDVKQDMTGALTMEDVLTRNGFDYVDSSLQIDPSAVGISWTDSTNGKTLTIGEEGKTIQTGKYTITYRVEKENFGVSADETGDVQNKISMRKDDESHSSDEKTSTSTKLIEKSGKASTDKNGDTIITWTIKLNSGDAKRYLQKAKFTDTIEGGQEYMNGSFTVKKNGKEDKSAQPTITGTTLSYDLDDGYNSYTITYKTKVTANIPLEGLTVSNTGNIDGDNGLNGSDTGSVDLKDEVLKKEADGDPTVAGNRATLNWKSTINADNLNGYVYYDYSDTFYLDDQNVNLQSIDLNDIQVLDKNQLDVTNQVAISTYNEMNHGVECGLFKIDFGSADIHGPVTIKYKTTVDTSRLGEYANITNKCYIVKDGHRQDSSASQRIHNVEDLWKTLIKYGSGWNQTGKGDITIGVGDEIPWTVVLNSGKVITGSKGQWTVQDKLPAGMLLDRASIGLNASQRGTLTEGTDYTITVFEGADGRTVLQIVFEESAYQNTDGTAATITLTYNTTLDPESEFCKGDQPTKDFVNDVSFSHDGTTQETNFTQTVTRNVVGKHGQFDSSTNLLSYTIEVNPDGSKLSPNGSDLELEDKLSVPRDLLGGYVSLEDITVFEAERQEDGSLVATNPIGDGLQRVDNQSEIDTSHYYTKLDNNGAIKFWTKVPDGTPRVLVVTYLVRDNLNGVKPDGTFTFTNKVQLGSKWKTEDKGSSASFSSGSTSGLDYNADRLTVMKYSGNVNNPLAGASFTLKKFDSANSAWTEVSSFTTDATGSKTLDGLARNTLYELTETAAPAGYLLPEPNKPYYFYITTDLNANAIPTAAGVDANLVTVYTVEKGVYRNFTFYRNNARNPDYVKEGDLLVKKAWKNFDGTDITDTSNLPEIVVTLTKHEQKIGNKITVTGGVWSETYTVADGSYFEFYTNSNYYNDRLSVTLQDGSVVPSTIGSDGCRHFRIETVNSDCSIRIVNTESDSNNPAQWMQFFYEKPDSSAVKTTDTGVGKVTLNSKNGWSARFENLEIVDGITYTINETSVEGYTASYKLNGNDLTEGNTFALGKNTGSNGNGDTIVITNTAEESGGYVLPSTGGAGTKLYTAGGGALMLAALVCGVCRKRRRERRAR